MTFPISNEPEYSTVVDVLSVARTAISFRRSQVIEYWLESPDMADKLHWSRVIQDLNDAHASLMFDSWNVKR